MKCRLCGKEIKPINSKKIANGNILEKYKCICGIEFYNEINETPKSKKR